LPQPKKLSATINDAAPIAISRFIFVCPFDDIGM